MDGIEQIVERAIAYTVTVLQTAPAHLDAACAEWNACEIISCSTFPNHPALDRLDLFLVELELRASQGAIH